MLKVSNKHRTSAIKDTLLPFDQIDSNNRPDCHLGRLVVGLVLCGIVLLTVVSIV